MINFNAYITSSISKLFCDNENYLHDYNKCNSLIKGFCGINNFFTSQEQANELYEVVKNNISIVSESNRREYGDFQTNQELTEKVVDYIYTKSQDFEFVLEPTCGKGNFIISSIKKFKTLKKVVGVEIYQPYVWETKFKILDYYLSIKNNESKPEIDIIHGNTFDYNYDKLAQQTKELKTLVVGNPPWVTNSELGSIDSKNLPQKSNFKKYSGFDAITGKGNFDISEYISIVMLKCFEKHNGAFAFLIKNSVVKNLIQEQYRNRFNISISEKLNIDSNGKHLERLLKKITSNN